MSLFSLGGGIITQHTGIGEIEHIIIDILLKKDNIIQETLSNMMVNHISKMITSHEVPFFKIGYCNTDSRLIKAIFS